jgi:hypothetical protein
MRLARFLLGLSLLSGAAWGFGHGAKTLMVGSHCHDRAAYGRPEVEAPAAPRAP